MIYELYLKSVVTLKKTGILFIDIKHLFENEYKT